MKRRNGRGAKGTQEGGGGMDRMKETKPAEVPLSRNERVPRAIRAVEIHARWAWVEPSVWTERMLTALEEGVKGGKWFSLMDKVYAPKNLYAAFQQVRANGGAAGVDHQTLVMFEQHLEANLEKLSRTLRDGTYRPREVRRKWIPKPGSNDKRPLGIPTVRDRVVQAALLNVLEPIFERNYAQQSYGFRPNRGCKDALRRVDALLQAGYTWIVDADLKSYFDTIPHEMLMERVKAKVSDGRVLGLIQSFLTQGVMDGMEHWIPDKGSPQGAVVSPLLSNIYLDPLDWKMAEAGIEMVRYADDFVLLCRTEEDARRALDRVQDWTVKAGLKLHPEKTRIVNAAEKGGFDFLGYHFERSMKWPRSKSLVKLKDAIRNKTGRNNGHSLDEIITGVNRTLRGWFEYFKHSHKTTFPNLDKWVRMRLRSILRRRQKKRGCGRGSDHHRWPNAFFAEHKLFSVEKAYAAACRS
jgi:RNA-directed DNA polymerase